MDMLRYYAAADNEIVRDKFRWTQLGRKREPNAFPVASYTPRSDTRSSSARPDALSMSAPSVLFPPPITSTTNQRSTDLGLAAVQPAVVTTTPQDNGGSSSAMTPTGGSRKRHDEPLESSVKHTRRRVDPPKQVESPISFNSESILTSYESCSAESVIEHLADIIHLHPSDLCDPLDIVTKGFWEGLGLFWNADRVAEWKGSFALEPVRKDPEGCSMVLKFWWLKPESFWPNVPDLPRDMDTAKYHIGLMDCRTEKPIQSGHEITLETPDPDNFPLPDFRILELQWILHRVAAISGAAGAWHLHQEPEKSKDNVSDLSPKLSAAATFDDRHPK
ncbi:hypothetical protein BO94DRAFT_549123 [Aspergillus sclerotioniger CBS 115572]|uniref:HNH nuclease domain-containing protein n=1 Tax=Aspergillus sclerotioniger CBS 115572 TaxID=1450535 RepID=A0A317VTR0_9EURO|nr:hypothetical protein BO94DRAFT_549123 [Aspergillus sclerotioniger CBS 115572]PWY77315.1 hypothetical protein BO94DRAFT_549123 [Aspergillus sclerotioniger CBS 115572]